MTVNKLDKFHEKQPSRGFLRKRCSENIVSIKLFLRFIEIAVLHGCSPVNLLHIFRTPFYKNNYRGFLLDFALNEIIPGKHLKFCSGFKYDQA